MKYWWHMDAAEAARTLATDLTTGLSAPEVCARLERYGPNALREGKSRGPVRIFLEQFADFIIWVLIAAAVVSGFLQEWVDALAIIAIVILNSILGFFQEHRAEKSLLALRKMAAPTSRVVRGGVRATIAASDLVPGDLIELEAGDHVPADGRVVWHTPNLAVQESSLTGESMPVLKTGIALDEKEVALADRANIVYLGTSVVSGKARAVVVETGMQTELGRIAGLIQSVGHEETPLQKRLEQFGKWIVYLCFGLVALVFGVELLRGGRMLDVFLTAVSLAVAAIPEGLPAVVTIALALGMQRMVRRHVLIRKLPAVETLGCATVICSDKTGTLTKNEMTVRAVLTASGLFQVEGVGYEPKGEFLYDGRAIDIARYPDVLACLRAGVLCNGAELVESDGRFQVLGDPTEGAILTVSGKAGLRKEPLTAEHPFVEEIPFDSERKRMTIIRRMPDREGYMAYVKGAPEILLGFCSSILVGDAVKPLYPDDVDRINRVNADLSDQALRVLAIAFRSFDANPAFWDSDKIETDLTFAGLVAMIDPPREEVKAAMAQCRTAGITTVMITGDHKNTAVAVARELGFYGPDSVARTGAELDGMDDATFEREVGRTAIFARVAPEHKLRAVRAWRKRGAVVAMTGDGVNDAPAVKEADIGVAMGITGTDVTKEVSDMIITDDNFASIVAAVEEGRGIYDNIKKFIHYLLSCNTGEILTMFVASLLGWPVPLFPIQILWINLVTDGLPALALGVDPVDPKIMDRPPRHPNEPIVTAGRVRLMLAQGAFIGFCSLLAFAYVYFIEGHGAEAFLGRARTAALFALASSQLFHAFNCRSLEHSLFKIGLFTNTKLLAASGLSLLLQVAILYMPFTQRVFKVVAMSPADLGILILISSLPLWAMEVFKLANRAARERRKT